MQQEDYSMLMAISARFNKVIVDSGLEPTANVNKLTVLLIEANKVSPMDLHALLAADPLQVLTEVTNIELKFDPLMREWKDQWRPKFSLPTAL